jgi:hypothetical protein
LTNTKKKDRTSPMNRSASMLLLWCAATSALAQTNGTPKIHFDKTVYDFGVTSLVESVTGTFTFQNVGDGVLHLQKPRPSCGCTVASVNPETLEPGETGELVFTIKVGTMPQRLDKEIFVPSNDPRNPNVQLGISVETLSLFNARPSAVSFGNLRVGLTTNSTITIKRTDGKKLTIARVESSSDQLSAAVVPREEQDNSETQLRVELKSGDLPRRFSEMLRLYTDDSIGAALTIFVTAKFVGDITIQPDAFAWGVPDPEHWSEKNPEVMRSQSVVVTSALTDPPLELRNLACDLKELRVRLVTLEKGKQYEIVARLTKRLTEPIHGFVSFETNLPSMPKVRIPVDINVWKE